MLHPLNRKHCYYSVYSKRNRFIELNGQVEQVDISPLFKMTVYQPDTQSLLPLTHALCSEEMTSCWVSLGFGAQLAICNCHFKRVPTACLHF